MSSHLGCCLIPSPAIIEKIGMIPGGCGVIHRVQPDPLLQFANGYRKIDVTRPTWIPKLRTVSPVVAIDFARKFRNVFCPINHKPRTASRGSLSPEPTRGHHADRYFYCVPIASLPRPLTIRLICPSGGLPSKALGWPASGDTRRERLLTGFHAPPNLRRE